MKLRELLALIEASDSLDLDAQVFIQTDGDLTELLVAEVDSDGDLVLPPDTNVTR